MKNDSQSGKTGHVHDSSHDGLHIDGLSAANEGKFGAAFATQGQKAADLKNDDEYIPGPDSLPPTPSPYSKFDL